MFSRRTMLAAGAALPLATDAASAKQLPAKVPLVGAWTLIDAMTVQRDGHAGPWDGFSGPYSGLIVYDPTGMMSVQIARGRPPLPDESNLNDLTVEQRLAYLASYDAYYGRYEFDPKASIVTHFVSSSLNPRLRSGSVVRRHVMLVDDVVTLSYPPATPTIGISSVLRWRRV